MSDMTPGGTGGALGSPSEAAGGTPDESDLPGLQGLGDSTTGADSGTSGTDEDPAAPVQAPGTDDTPAAAPAAPLPNMAGTQGGPGIEGSGSEETEGR